MWIWLVRPSRRFYAYMGSDGGAVPYGALALMAAICGIGAGVGLVVARLTGDESGDFPWVGAGIAFGGWMLWSVVAVVTVLVARLLKVDDPGDSSRARRAR